MIDFFEQNRNIFLHHEDHEGNEELGFSSTWRYWSPVEQKDFLKQFFVSVKK